MIAASLRRSYLQASGTRRRRRLLLALLTAVAVFLLWLAAPRSSCEQPAAATSFVPSDLAPYAWKFNASAPMYPALLALSGASEPPRRSLCGRPGEPRCPLTSWADYDARGGLQAVRPPADVEREALRDVQCEGFDLAEHTEVKELKECAHVCAANAICAAAVIRRGHCVEKRAGVQCWPGGDVRAWLKPGALEAALTRGSLDQLLVIVPVRNREVQEKAFMERVPQMLERQGVQYSLIFLEQDAGYKFNRGALINAALILALQSDFHYLLIHDVDTLPKTERVRYDAFPERPTHLTPSWNHPVYHGLEFLGGNIVFPKDALQAIDGFPSELWGWGQEDDVVMYRYKKKPIWPPYDARVNLSGVNWHEAWRVLWEHLDGNHTQRENRGFWAANDYGTGLSDTRFWVAGVEGAYGGRALRVTVHIECEEKREKWCLP
eukprot:tig00021179_g19224.t1